jgi:hypothetical protein
MSGKVKRNNTVYDKSKGAMVDSQPTELNTKIFDDVESLGSSKEFIDAQL